MVLKTVNLKLLCEMNNKERYPVIRKLLYDIVCFFYNGLSYFFGKCRYAKTCTFYRKDRFDCTRQEIGNAVVCGIWRINNEKNKII